MIIIIITAHYLLIKHFFLYSATFGSAFDPDRIIFFFRISEGVLSYPRERNHFFLLEDNIFVRILDGIISHIFVK